MSESSQSLNDRFSALDAKFRKLGGKRIEHFSGSAVREFNRGFDIPLIGILEYLRGHIPYFEDIRCQIDGQHISPVTIVDFDSYGALLPQLLKIAPPSTIDCSFIFQKPVFAFGGNFNVKFSVFFHESRYEVVFIYEDNKRLSFEKPYMAHLEAGETHELMGKISEIIINKLSAILDAI